MELWEATKLAFRNYASFAGRTTRADYWYFILALFIAQAALSVISDDVARVFSIVTLLPWLTSTIRRLRDVQRSPHSLWWLLLPIVGWIILIVQLAEPSKD
ncbi:MAG: hypothetical protein RJB32_671 [Actinomycetota bacterium]|jgi:uncharacterized membrane protein YhaH (DUF805 family)